MGITGIETDRRDYGKYFFIAIRQVYPTRLGIMYIDKPLGKLLSFN
jgi:hypothetical protein